ncbi:MAG: putative zinc-binding protein, partial [Anaerolineales bacterium]
MKNENQNNSHRIAIVPCSGIGKTYGTVSRLAAYQLVDDLCPDSAQLVPLSLLVLGDEETRAKVENNQAVTIDGCKLACAKKMVAECGGEVI